MKSRFAFIAAAALLLLSLMTSCINGAGNDPLTGTSWQVVTLDDAPVIRGTKLSASFSSGKITGSSGCNSYGGSYKVNGQKITTSSIAMTLMACADSRVMEQEQVFLVYLQDARSFKLSSGQLQIFRSDAKALTLVPLG